MIYEQQYLTAWLFMLGAFTVSLLLFYRYIRWIRIAEIRFWLIFAVSILCFYPTRIMTPEEHVVPTFIVFGFEFVDSKFNFAATWPLLEMPVYLIGFLGLVLVFAGLMRSVFFKPKLAKDSKGKSRRDPDMSDD